MSNPNGARRLSTLTAAIVAMGTAHGEHLPPGVDIRQPTRTMADTMKRIPIRPAKNRPCPCGSGRKYKKCCDPHRKAAA